METDYFDEDVRAVRNLIESMNTSKRMQQQIDSGQITKFDLAEKLGISRVTLDTRLTKDNWKKGELAILKLVG